MKVFASVDDSKARAGFRLKFYEIAEYAGAGEYPGTGVVTTYKMDNTTVVNYSRLPNIMVDGSTVLVVRSMTQSGVFTLTAKVSAQKFNGGAAAHLSNFS